MRLTILELEATWGTPERVLAHVDAQLTAGPATDLVLLPEAAFQGYVSPDGDFNAGRFAEPIEGPTASAARVLAERHRAHVAAPLILSEGTHRFNAVVLFDPSGERVFTYRKRHPWLPETWATAGAEPPPIAEIGGVKTTIAICFDLHFLPEDAHRQLTDADLLLFPSAWVEEQDTRVDHLCRLSKAYGLHTANANWAAGVVRIPGQGGSCFIDPDGNVRARVQRGRCDVEL